jgi:hypothetical protein
MSVKRRGKVTIQKNDFLSTKNQLGRKLLQPGWAGELSGSEVEYIQRELRRSQRLWRKWGYVRAMLKGVSIPSSTIRRVAKHGLR